MVELAKKNKIFIWIIAGVLLITVILSLITFMPKMSMDVNYSGNTKKENKELAKETKSSIKKLLADGRYKCCLTKPCTYCFSDPGHQDKELVCGCLNEIMNGRSPCGECLGEILEGEGIAIISEYFATAIAEELGQKHLASLKQIISEKYDMPIEKQI